MSLLDRRTEPNAIDGEAQVDFGLPQPRGPRTEHVLEHLSRRPHEVGPLPRAEDDPLEGEDSPLALHLLYELHYRGAPGVDERWEWEPSVLAMRAQLEAELEDRLLAEVGPIPIGCSRADVVAELDELAKGTPAAPSLSSWMLRHAALDHVREFAVHRSIYQLKEADPHTFAIPRLTGRAKAAMVEIQRGEYGDGDPAAMHATLFATTMRLLDLDDRYGAYLDDVPGVTLSTGNLINLFGLHRRWRAAAAGHLALFEMTSVEPMRRYAATLRRLGVPEQAIRFYDVHVEADAEHQVIGRDDLAGGIVDDEPILGGDVVFGARALTIVEGRFAQHLLGCWQRGESSLRRPSHGARSSSG